MPSLVATLKVREDKIEEAKTLFKELAAGVRENEPGTLAYVFHQKKDEPTTFVVYEKYESDEAFATHGQNLRAQGARFAGVLAGAPEMLMLEEI